MRSQEREPDLVRAGGSEIHRDMSSDTGNLQEKMHMDMSQGTFCVEIYRKNAGGYFRGTRFVCKFTGKNAHGHYTRAILCGNLQENAGHVRPHLDLHGPLFTLTVRTPSVWPHCLGKKEYYMFVVGIPCLALGPICRGTRGDIEFHQLRHGFQSMQCTPHCLSRDDGGGIMVYILAPLADVTYPFPILSQLIGTSGYILSSKLSNIQEVQVWL